MSIISFNYKKREFSQVKVRNKSHSNDILNRYYSLQLAYLLAILSNKWNWFKTIASHSRWIGFICVHLVLTKSINISMYRHSGKKFGKTASKEL
jgi:hypothetical protein